jgi:DNA-binding transcriptional regulator YhcF (GntR family)
VRAGVRDGSIVPSIRGVQAAVRCGAPTVRRYLAQLEAEGLIRRTERGYERVREAQAAAA